MLLVLTILHYVVCVLLTIIVLLQFGKGAEVGAMMGGGASQAVFTSSGKGNFFTKVTTVLAIVFLVNSWALSRIKSKAVRESVLDNEAPIAAPLNSDQNPEQLNAAVSASTATTTATATTATK